MLNFYYTTRSITVTFKLIKYLLAFISFVKRLQTDTNVFEIIELGAESC